MIINDLRKKYHKNIFEQVLSVDKSGVPSNADKHSKISTFLAKEIVQQIAIKTSIPKISAQTSGKNFEQSTVEFIKDSIQFIQHLRGGEFEFFIGKSIEEFEQYEHLALLSEALKTNRELKATLGDYLINPDIVIGRYPVEDDEINRKDLVVKNRDLANLTPLRKTNSSLKILHASISCKWTIRSDRSQNARTEGLNLIRNRRGHTPHIVIVTAEPYPRRIASLALGTGDIDCVYHFALNELLFAADKLNNEAVTDILETLVQGKRLRDISDLPFDLMM